MTTPEPRTTVILNGNTGERTVVPLCSASMAVGTAEDAPPALCEEVDGHAGPHRARLVWRAED